jgi:transposase
MPNSPPYNREAIRAVYDQGPEAVVELIERLWSLQQETLEAMEARNRHLEARVKALEDRLAQDSRNSGKPPSSDGLKRKPASLREKSGKPSGGQKGHAGKTLEFCDAPDERIVHAPSHCDRCGVELSEGETVGTERRQVFDLPPMKLHVTEYQAESRQCPCCGTINRGIFPEGMTHPVQYGAGVKALLVYLQSYQLLPYARTCELFRDLFRDLFGASISEGTLFEAIQTGSSSLEGTEGAIREAITQAQVAHFDETGLRIEGRLHWLRSASTEALVYYSPQKKRGHEGMRGAGVLPRFQGRAVHDGWASYFTYSCDHALCNAHHLRELTFLAERHAQAWAAELKGLLIEMKQTVEAAKEAGKSALTKKTLRSLVKRYDAALKQGERANPLPPPEAVPRRGRKKQTPARNLLDRLRRSRRETLAFLYDFAVPFDNNRAEREIRMMKVQQKISGGFRSQDGAEAFCRIRGYIASARKQAHPVLFALQQLFLGHPLTLVPHS